MMETSNNIVARQHHQVIAFGEDHETWRRSDPADHVEHRVCVANKGSKACLYVRHNWPDKRLLPGGRILPSGPCRLRFASAQSYSTQGPPKESTPHHHVRISARPQLART